MCGVAGWVDFERDMSREVSVTEAMGATLACRGPDESGRWASRHCSFAHRRLVVVDPAGGGQPMVRALGQRRGAITYNGELYNTEELRADLAACGWRFEGYSDTEVLLAAYLQWGAGCLVRLNGIFAFAIWTEPDETLFAARDRLGVKPFFYALRGGGLLFGSELKALLAHPAVEPELDAEGLAEIFVMGPGRTPGHGVFRNVHELRPGWWLTFGRDGLKTGRYWALESRPHLDSPAQTAERVRALLQDAVERQLVSDVPVCTLLSGGLDSSAVTAFAAMAYRRRGAPPLRTFSVDHAGSERHFRPTEFQPDADPPFIEAVSRRFGTRHRTVLVNTRDLAASLRAAVRARDLPGMADVDSSLLLFCRGVKKEATVALSGECADELFGGYPWFRRAEDLASGTFPWMRQLGRRLALYSGELRTLMGPADYLRRRYEEALAEVPRLAGEPPQEARMREVLYLTLSRFMPVLLERKDRMSMASGLEVRVPYCDHRLVEYAWNIPWPVRWWGGQEKGILRRALAGLLPEQVLARRKSPYPKTHDPAYLETVRRWVLDILDDPASPLRELVDAQAVREFACQEAGQMNLPWFGQLMGGPQLLAYLAQVDTWMREYRVSVRA